MTHDHDNSQHYNHFLAQWYDLLIKEETGDLTFYQEILTHSGQPVLELACGTGRLLIEYLKTGIDIDGLDSSAAMLEICTQKIKALGLQNTLYCQRVQDLTPQRQYQTIFIAGGSFQLIDRYDDALSALEKIYQALLPGGKFITDLFIPWGMIIANQEGLWRLGRTANRNDGTTFVANHSDELDLKNQIIHGTTRYEVFKENRLTDSYLDRINLKWYSINEFILMMEKIGFKNIQTQAKNLISTHGEATVYTGYK